MKSPKCPERVGGSAASLLVLLLALATVGATPAVPPAEAQTAEARITAAMSNPQATNDASNVYYQFTPAAATAFRRVYIDTDRNAATGFAVQGVGANFLLENGSLYRHNGPGWNWQHVRAVTHTTSATLVKWSVPRADIGESATPNDADLVFQVEAPLETSAVLRHLYSHATPAKFLIPAYFYPDGSNWQNLCKSYLPAQAPLPRPAGAVAIMNPASGPGSSADPSYVAAVDSCTRWSSSAVNDFTGVPVIGYVATTYGKRPIALVKADIDKYYRWYAVRGIFLDEMDRDAGSAQYYRQIYAYIKAKADPSQLRPRGTLVVGNPGAAASSAWQVTAPAVADIVVIFEGAAADYLKWTPPTWVYSVPRRATANLVYGANGDPTQVAEICRVARQRNVGWMDVTQDVLPNPWNTMPDSRQITYC